MSILHIRFTAFLHATVSAIFILLALCNATLHAQTVQWASQVLSFSSRVKIDGRSWIGGKWTHEYAPEQVLGKPNKCPADGDSPCAWAGSSDNEFFGGQGEHIKVGYNKPMQIQ